MFFQKSHAKKTNLRSPTEAMFLLFRISVGLSLVFIGIENYMSIANSTVDGSIVSFVSGGLGVLGQVGMIWAYVYPLLFIIGGALLILGMYLTVAAWTAGLALAVIPAGMLLKSVIDPATTPFEVSLPTSVTALIWVIVFLLVLKHEECHCEDCK